LKTVNGEREIDLHSSVAKLLIEFIGDRTEGLVFQTKTGKPLAQSNILRRVLHPALEAIGQPKAGAHAFRRFRNTHLRNFTSCPEGILKFWMGHGEKTMSEHYDRIKADVSFRKDVAERAGVGFDVPAQLNLVEPKSEPVTVEEVLVSVEKAEEKWCARRDSNSRPSGS
jgi:integrase